MTEEQTMTDAELLAMRDAGPRVIYNAETTGYEAWVGAVLLSQSPTVSVAIARLRKSVLDESERLLRESIRIGQAAIQWERYLADVDGMVLAAAPSTPDRDNG